ncbi:hypothetical protein WA556_002023 [Blastocystis sp. ATCC 50177/Nand II]
MALIRSASSLSATFASQAPRVAPVVLNRVSGALSYNNRNAAPVQRRTFLVGTIINLSFDAIFLTTAASAMRRVSGIDLHNYAKMIEDPRWRSYCLRYLDFGETCADKCIRWFRKQRDEDRREEEEKARRHQADNRQYYTYDYYQQSQPKERDSSYDSKKWN